MKKQVTAGKREHGEYPLPRDARAFNAMAFRPFTGYNVLHVYGKPARRTLESILRNGLRWIRLAALHFALHRKGYVRTHVFDLYFYVKDRDRLDAVPGLLDLVDHYRRN